MINVFDSLSVRFHVLFLCAYNLCCLEMEIYAKKAWIVLVQLFLQLSFEKLVQFCFYVLFCIDQCSDCREWIWDTFCLLLTWLYLFFNSLYFSFISFIYLASILISEANAGRFLGTALSTQSRHEVSQQHLFTCAHQCPFGETLLVCEEPLLHRASVHTTREPEKGEKAHLKPM